MRFAKYPAAFVCLGFAVLTGDPPTDDYNALGGCYHVFYTAVNYHGSSGYGKEFVDSVSGRVGEIDVKDTFVRCN